MAPSSTGSTAWCCGTWDPRSYPPPPAAAAGVVVVAAVVAAEDAPSPPRRRESIEEVLEWMFLGWLPPPEKRGLPRSTSPLGSGRRRRRRPLRHRSSSTPHRRRRRHSSRGHGIDCNVVVVVVVVAVVVVAAAVAAPAFDAESKRPFQSPGLLCFQTLRVCKVQTNHEIVCVRVNVLTRSPHVGRHSGRRSRLCRVSRTVVKRIVMSDDDGR